MSGVFKGASAIAAESVGTVNDDEGDDDPGEVEQPTPPKRGRGRPRKNPVPESADIPVEQQPIIPPAVITPPAIIPAIPPAPPANSPPTEKPAPPKKLPVSNSFNVKRRRG